jgi:hypothetical protein
MPKVVNALPRIVLFARFLGLDTGDTYSALPLESLSVYLALLLKLRRGKVPLVETSGEREEVPTAEVLDAVDFVLARLTKHALVELKMHFQRDVSKGLPEVDLDTALLWLTQAFKVRCSVRLYVLHKVCGTAYMSSCVYALLQRLTQPRKVHAACMMAHTQTWI